MLNRRSSTNGSAPTRKLAIFGAALLAGLFNVTVQAFPSLNLAPLSPDILSSFITVDYVGNDNAGTLTANGFAQALSPPGVPDGQISGGSFNISSAISFNNQTATGSLNIGGTIAGLGYNSGTLLTGVLKSFGAGPGDPLEYTFDITGGDAAGVYGGIGAVAGVILGNSGYSGSFANSFTSGAFQAQADTFKVPLPGSLVLMLLGGGLLLFRRRNSITDRGQGQPAGFSQASAVTIIT